MLGITSIPSRLIRVQDGRSVISEEIATYTPFVRSESNDYGPICVPLDLPLSHLTPASR